MAAIKEEFLPENAAERLRKVYPHTLGQRYIKTSPGNCTLPVAYKKFKGQYKNWHNRPDDIFVLGFPKSGTTWAQELVWCIQNDCNLDMARSKTPTERVGFVDSLMLFDLVKNMMPFTQTVPEDIFEKMASPRTLKSHLPLCLLPDNLLDKSKAIFCLRNPKDTVVSMYHHEKHFLTLDYTGDFPTYFDLFMDNISLYTPYFDHVVEAWKKRSHPNVCVLFYEDMKSDLPDSVRKVATFLGKEINEKQVDFLADHLSFKRMKENIPMLAPHWKKLSDANLLSKDGSFFRKGEVGDWKNYFTKEMNERMNLLIENNLKPAGLEFQYE